MPAGLRGRVDVWVGCTCAAISTFRFTTCACGWFPDEKHKQQEIARQQFERDEAARLEVHWARTGMIEVRDCCVMDVARGVTRVQLRKLVSSIERAVLL